MDFLVTDYHAYKVFYWHVNYGAHHLASGVPCHVPEQPLPAKSIRLHTEPLSDDLRTMALREVRSFGPCFWAVGWDRRIVNKRILAVRPRGSYVEIDVSFDDFTCPESVTHVITTAASGEKPGNHAVRYVDATWQPCLLSACDSHAGLNQLLRPIVLHTYGFVVTRSQQADVVEKIGGFTAEQAALREADYPIRLFEDMVEYRLDKMGVAKEFARLVVRSLRIARPDVELDVPLVIRGSASVTANLLEWQNGSGIAAPGN